MSCGTPVKAVAIGIVAAVVAVASGDAVGVRRDQGGGAAQRDGGAEGTAQWRQRITAVVAKGANPPATP